LPIFNKAIIKIFLKKLAMNLDQFSYSYSSKNKPSI
jgi:hypothetical protein